MDEQSSDSCSLAEVYKMPAERAIPILLNAWEVNGYNAWAHRFLIIKQVQNGQLADALAQYCILLDQMDCVEEDVAFLDRIVLWRVRLAFVRVCGDDDVDAESLEQGSHRFLKDPIETPIDRIEACWFKWAVSVLLGKETLDSNSIPSIDIKLHEIDGLEVTCEHTTLRLHLELTHAAGNGVQILTQLALNTNLVDTCGTHGDCSLSIWLEILKDHCPRVCIPAPLWEHILEDVRSSLEQGDGSITEWRLPIGVRLASILLQLAPYQGGDLPDWILDEVRKGLTSQELPLRIRAAAALARYEARSRRDRASHKAEARRLVAIALDAAKRLDARNGNDSYVKFACSLLRHGTTKPCSRVNQEGILWPTIIPVDH